MKNTPGRILSTGLIETKWEGDVLTIRQYFRDSEDGDTHMEYVARFEDVNVDKKKAEVETREYITNLLKIFDAGCYTKKDGKWERRGSAKDVVAAVNRPHPFIL